MAELEPSWQQVAAKLGNDIAKMAMWESVLEALGEFRQDFQCILADALDIQN